MVKRRKKTYRRSSRAKLPRVIKSVNYQTGKTTRDVDVVRIALKPGWRLSRTNRRYFEARRNRSDLNKRKRY